MTRFGALFLVTALGCSSSAASTKLSEDVPAVDGGIGGSSSIVARGGSNQGGSADVGEDAGAADAGEPNLEGSDAGDAGTVEPGDAGGQVAEGGHGGSAGSSGGSGGSDQGGSDQGGTGGSAPDPDPCVDGYHCDGLTLTVCDGGEEVVTQCGTLEEGLYCSETEGCYGVCVDGDARCSGEAAEACVDGEWVVTEECAFQCVAGACEGACTPGTVVCNGLSTATCGSDFHFGSPVACPTEEFSTTTCSGGVCGLEPIACSEGTADCDENGSCESSLSSVTSCGECGVVCPAVDNASTSCNGSCGFNCDDGFSDCDGDGGNGCEIETSTDALNCGACGNSCYGGACTEGVCDYTFEVVSDFSAVAGDGHVLDMVVGPAHVYWWTYDHGSNVIRRAPKDGGEFDALTSFTTISPPAARDNVLLVDNGLLYWATDDGIYRMPEAGGTPVELSSFGASSLAIDDGKLYWNDSHLLSDAGLCSDAPLHRPNVVQACNAGKVTTFYTLDLTTLGLTQWQATGEEYSPVLGVIGDEVFVTRFQFVGPSASDFHAAIITLDTTTGANSRLIADSVLVEDTPYGMTSSFGQAVVSESEIVFTTSLQPDPFSGIVGMCRTPLNVAQPHLETTFVKTVAGPTPSAQYLAADATHAYYSAVSTLIERVSLVDGSVETPFGASGDNTKVVVDATHVYWSASIPVTGERAILRAAK